MRHYTLLVQSYEYVLLDGDINGKYYKIILQSWPCNHNNHKFKIVHYLLLILWDPLYPVKWVKNNNLYNLLFPCSICAAFTALKETTYHSYVLTIFHCLPWLMSSWLDFQLLNFSNMSSTSKFHCKLTIAADEQTLHTWDFRFSLQWI